MEKSTPRKTEKLDFEKVWLMFQETDRKFQETKDLMAKSSLETDRKFQETKDLLAKSSLETDAQFKKLMNKLSEIETRWGKFVESLVEGTLLKLLNLKGISVQHTFLRAKGSINNKQYEIDIIAKNGLQVLAVEVKTTLSVNDVKKFISTLKVFKEVFPEYSTNEVLGAVAYISVEEKADKFAARNGLFVIEATNKSARIRNRETFKPKIW